MSFTGGPLKLKGQPIGGVKKKKKHSSKEKELALAAEDKQQEEKAAEASTSAAAGGAAVEGRQTDLKRALHGYELPTPDENADRRTAAEKRFQERQIKLEQERLTKQASKSHRDRVKEFNDYLAKLSEHHDIPRVGPG